MKARLTFSTGRLDTNDYSPITSARRKAMRLKNQVAIVTGSGQGIGYVLAKGLAAEGAKVVITALNLPEAEAAAAAICTSGGDAIGTKLDVCSTQDMQAMVERTKDAFGRIDILVNNAGAFASTYPRKPFWELTVEEWDMVMETNTRGTFLCIQSVFPVMKAQNRGKIINISSGTIFRGIPRGTHYVASKAAIIGLTRQLAHELGPYNIAINAITPGLVMSEGALKVISPEQAQHAVQARIFKRPEEPQDLVGTTVFLASSDSDFMTGQTINVDGGTNFV
jgi:NAD(P)-dependent dehydrogenase (short-subunit alcohol dehydrogenase family)